MKPNTLPRFTVGLCKIAAVAGIFSIALGMPALAQRSEIVIPASELATSEQRADAPTPGKWWLDRQAQDWGARTGHNPHDRKAK